MLSTPRRDVFHASPEQVRGRIAFALSTPAPELARALLSGRAPLEVQA